MIIKSKKSMEKHYPKYSKNNIENGWNYQSEYILYITLPLNRQFHQDAHFLKSSGKYLMKSVFHCKNTNFKAKKQYGEKLSKI